MAKLEHQPTYVINDKYYETKKMSSITSKAHFEKERAAAELGQVQHLLDWIMQN